MARIGYARVSNIEAARDGNALEQQQQRLRQAGCERLYTDVQSGTNDNRPQLRKALAALAASDTLVATRLDRITRSPRFNEQLLAQFDGSGPSLELLDDALNTGSVGGRMMARMLAAMSAAEVERLAERVAHGRAHRQGKGGHGARPPWGFLRAPDGLGLVVDPELAPICRGLISEFLARRSIRGASSWLLEAHRIRKSKSSMRRWLLNPALCGGIGRASGSWADREVERSDGTIYKERYRRPPEPGIYDSIEWDRHEGLISRTQWDEVQRALAVSKERGGGAHRAAIQRTWTSGRFRCGECGGLLQRHHRRLRCIQSACSWRYGAGSISMALARASLVRALEWCGSELAHALAPLQAAAESTTAVESPEALKLREEIHRLRSLEMEGLEDAIAAKEQQLAALTVAIHSETVTAAEKLAQLLPLLRRPWELSDEELTQLLDDIEMEARTTEGNWVGLVWSKRFRCGWSFAPTSLRETFRISPDAPVAASREQRLGLEEPVALAHTIAWWHEVEEECRRREVLAD